MVGAGAIRSRFLCRGRHPDADDRQHHHCGGIVARVLGVLPPFWRDRIGHGFGRRHLAAYGCARLAAKSEEARPTGWNAVAGIDEGCGNGGLRCCGLLFCRQDDCH